MNAENLAVTVSAGNTALVSAPMTCDVEQSGIDISVSAETRESIAQGQRRLTEWCDRKLEDLRRELAELECNLEEARRGNWNLAPFRRTIARTERHLVYYRKMKAAFLEGYVLVPNFPLSVFAIRTDRKLPLELASFSEWGKTQHAKPLEQGEGEYQSPNPLISGQDIEVPKLGKPGEFETKIKWRAVEWDELDFPLTMAKPHLIAAVNHAQALKLFDEIGILPTPRSAKGDPLICGTIICADGTRWSRKRVTFMVAWHVDTRTL